MFAKGVIQMSDTKDVNFENETEIIDNSEYERALEVLNSSKGSRVKKIKEKKAKNPSKPAPKIDPVIPVCIVAAFLVLTGALIYFILPVAVNPSMKLTYEEFTDNYRNTALYVEKFNDLKIDIGGVKYLQDTDPGSLAFKVHDEGVFVDSFEKIVNPNYGLAIQGQSRKFDGKLTFIRAIAEYDDFIKNTTVTTYYFANIFNSVYRNVSGEDCFNMSADLLKNLKKYTDGSYTVNGDYAYRVIYGANSSAGTAFLALEIVPAAKVN